MALIECPECKKMISSTAIICPHCGFVHLKKNKRKKKIEIETKNGFLIAFGVVALFFIIIGMVGPHIENAVSSPEISKIVKDNIKITYELQNTFNNEGKQKVVVRVKNNNPEKKVSGSLSLAFKSERNDRYLGFFDYEINDMEPYLQFSGVCYIYPSESITTEHKWLSLKFENVPLPKNDKNKNAEKSSVIPKYEIVHSFQCRFDGAMCYFVYTKSNYLNPLFREDIRAIISDMSSKYSKKISINFYDSKMVLEFDYNRLKPDHEFKLRTEKENEELTKHCIAVFDGGGYKKYMHNDKLWFYPNASENVELSKFQSQEIYVP